jgi:outer membrane protein OmpA-like peptidoglycan-associated protein
VISVVLAAVVPLASAQSDVAKSRDHPLFNRLAGFYIEDYQASDFNSHEFYVGKPNDDWEMQSIEGKKTVIVYRIKEGAKQPSSLQIVRNYANAVAQSGGKQLYENKDPGARMVTLRLQKSGQDIWVSVEASGDSAEGYQLTIVERGEIAQEITASSIFDALSKQGRIALYINFDTGKATIKAESQPVVKQVVDMMKAHPEVKVAVEGHTDNVGAPAANKALSEQRAKAVVAAIAALGVSADRLSAAGFGQEKPLASNAAEDGRAKNRRVELVKK